jgi:hypothetical protein
MDTSEEPLFQIPNQAQSSQYPCDPAIPLLGVYLKDSKSAHNRDTCILMFIAAYSQ